MSDSGSYIRYVLDRTVYGEFILGADSTYYMNKFVTTLPRGCLKFNNLITGYNKVVTTLLNITQISTPSLQVTTRL